MAYTISGFDVIDDGPAMNGHLAEAIREWL
jgi:hypothetical protein